MSFTLTLNIKEIDKHNVKKRNRLISMEQGYYDGRFATRTKGSNRIYKRSKFKNYETA